MCDIVIILALKACGTPIIVSRFVSVPGKLTAACTSQPEKSKLSSKGKMTELSAYHTHTQCSLIHDKQQHGRWWALVFVSPNDMCQTQQSVDTGAKRGLPAQAVVRVVLVGCWADFYKLCVAGQPCLLWQTLSPSFAQ